MSKINFAIIIIGLFLAACSDKAVLKVNNLTDEKAHFTVDEKHYSLESGETHKEDWKLKKNLFSTDEVSVQVEVEEMIYVLPETFKKSIKSGRTFVVDIEYNAASIKIVNEKDVDLVSLFIFPEGSLEWGENYLDNNISPGSFFRANLKPGTYDLIIEDNHPGGHFSYKGQTFRVGLTRTYYIN